MNPGLADHERGNRAAIRFSAMQRHYDNLTPDDNDPFRCRDCDRPCDLDELDEDHRCPECAEERWA